MIYKWSDIEWIFEPDGSLRDIYVQDVSLNDWEKLIDHLNDNFNLKYSDKDYIDKDYVLNYLQDQKGEMECKSLCVNIASIKVNCHFFLSEQIEFDCDPDEINSIKDFEAIETFMSSVSSVLGQQVTLTGENSPEFPLIKIDVRNNINKILSEKEAENLLEKRKSITNQLDVLKNKIERKFFPNYFMNKLLKNANKEYKATKKENNVW